MKRTFLWVMLAALVILFGSACGGGGGTGSNGNPTDGGGTGTFTNVQVNATLQSGGNFGVDTRNLAVGDQVQLRLTGRNSQGQTVNVNASNWTTDAPASVATLTSGGVLTAVGSSGNATYTISVQGPNGTVTVPLAVRPAQAFVTGFVRNVNGTGIGSTEVLFYNDAGTLVGQSRTSSNGTFRANVPSTATRFTVDIEDADPGPNPIYYRQFDYTAPGGVNRSYLAGEPTCRASLPTLTNGTTTPIADIVVAARVSGPPPPPSGCVGG